MSESGPAKIVSLETTTGLPHANQVTTLREKLSSGDSRDNTHEQTVNSTTSTQMSPRTPNPSSTTTMSANVSYSLSDSVNFVKIETSEGPQTVGEPLRLDVNSEQAGSTDQALVTEEPLEIQCGENSALLYVSKLCQGSKGPCILFNGEWLTPNELQYISGRETAKDWKRSIRFKGKSLKSLIARGLIKVHPPICDCLGCRISSPVNRGRLASKCSVSPTSPAKKRKEPSKSVSSWRNDGFDVGMFHRPRHFSSSDVDRCSIPSASNGTECRDSRDSNSSTTSDCSEVGDDSPFTPVEAKRPRSSSPENSSKSGAMKRMSTDRFHYDQRNAFFFRDLPPEYSGAELSAHKKDISVELSNPHRSHSQEAAGVSPSNRSAFRAVHQDGSSALNSVDDISSEVHVNTDVLQKEIAARVAKNSKQQPLLQQQQQQQQQQPVGCQASAFFGPFSQLSSPSPLISPSHSSPRLIPDPLLLTSPHGSGIYHQALRGGLSGLPSLHQGLMHYRLLAPPSQHNAISQAIPLQSSLIQANAAAAAAAVARAGLQSLPVSSFKMQHNSKPTSPKDTSLLNGHTDENQNLTKCRVTDEEVAKKLVTNSFERDRDNEADIENSKSNSRVPLSDRESVIRRSPDVCTASNERQSPFSTSKASPSGKDVSRIPPHKLVPRFWPESGENVLEWTVDDVCQFVTSLTGTPDIAHAFREEHIDGHSFVLMQEEHLLNRMSIRLGPALKIIAQIKKLTENLEENNSS